MVKYCTVSDVSNELNGLTIDATTTPSESTVEDWIEQASRQVELLTQQVFSSVSVTGELHDYDGSGVIHTYNYPIISVDSLKVETNGVNASSENWVTLSEGRTSSDDFIVYSDEGEIKLTQPSVTVPVGFQNIDLSYTYGYSSTPTEVVQLTALIAARRVVKSFQDASAAQEGGDVSVGTIKVTDPSQFGSKRLDSIQKDIDSLVSKIGSFKVYRRVDRVYD